MSKKTILRICLCLLAVFAVLGVVFRDPIIDWLPIDQSGWDTLKSGETCYLDEDGDPVSGWLELDSGVYYFRPESGAMQTGWLELESGRYFLGDDGVRRTGWQTVDGLQYYLNESGAALSGWLEQDGSRMYLNEVGTPCTGWLTLEEGTYYLDENGYMTTGWMELDGNRYYLNDEGIMATGFLLQGDDTFYLGEDGVMQTGWQNIEENRYYFGDTGVMTTGWLELDGQKYYLKADGSAAKGKLVIDEETFYFTSKGAQVILVNRWNLLPADYEAEVVESVDGCWMAVSCNEATQKLLAALKAEVGTVGYLTGYRTYGTQYLGFYTRIERLMAKGYNYSNAYRMVSRGFAFPGSSEHQLGTAVDIMDPADHYYENEDSKILTWLKEHCWEYGFIMRYPNEKSHITGIIYEPWHYRYVGVELAMELKDSGLCLEEYLDNLTNDGTTCGNPDALNAQ